MVLPHGEFNGTIPAPLAIHCENFRTTAVIVSRSFAKLQSWKMATDTDDQNNTLPLSPEQGNTGHSQVIIS